MASSMRRQARALPSRSPQALPPATCLRRLEYRLGRAVWGRRRRRRGRGDGRGGGGGGEG
eukprot:9465963-Pyramimonas_sp.AAC.3